MPLVVIDASGNGFIDDVGNKKWGPQTDDSTSDDFEAITAGVTGRLTRYIYVSADCDVVAKNKWGANITHTGLKGGGMYPIRTTQVVSISSGSAVGYY